MPNISERGQLVPMSPFRKLMPSARIAKEKGIEVIHLNIGQPDILTPSDALFKTKKEDHSIIKYSPGIGVKELRTQFCKYLNGRGVQMNSEEIIITSGASEGLYFIFLACFAQGDEVIVPEPFYANYNGFAHMTGVEIVPVTCQIEDNFRLPEIEEFENKIGKRTKAILITNPNNPTGQVYKKEELIALGELAKKHDLFLISDEVYQDFCFSQSAFYSAASIKGLEENVLVVDSVSKKYSACGARIGFLYTKNKEVFSSIERLAKLRLSPPHFGERLAIHMLENDESYLTKSQAEYDKRRLLVFNRLSNIPEVTCYLPDGAFYCFARFPVEDSEDFCKWLLESFRKNNQTVMLSPGSGFYKTPGLGLDEVRIAFVLEEKKLNQAMDILESAIAVYPKKLKEIVT